MTNEQIRNEINEATRDFRETTRKVNEALNHAAGRLDKAEKEAYDRGLNDCWDMIRKLRKIDFLNRKEIFSLDHGTFISNIVDEFTPQQALAKIRAWEEKKAEEERKKKEEAEKIQIGDVVEATVGCPVRQQLKGIFLMETDASYNILDPTGNVYICMKENNPIIKKTGEHVDILGALKE